MRIGLASLLAPLASVCLFGSMAAACGSSGSSGSTDAPGGSPGGNGADGGDASASVPPGAPDGGCNVAVTLQPAPSAVYMLHDYSSGTRDYFGVAAISESFGLLMSGVPGPRVAMKLTPAPASDCTAAPSSNSFANPSRANGDVPFEPTVDAARDATGFFSALAPDGGVAPLPPDGDPWFLEAALDGAYTALQTTPVPSTSASAAQGWSARTAILFLARDFATAPGDCGAAHRNAIDEATAAFTNAGIETYVVLERSAETPTGTPAQTIADAQKLGQASDAAGQAHFFDATAQGALYQATMAVVTRALAGKCAFEMAPSLGPTSSLRFADLSIGAFVDVAYATDGACTGDSDTTPLWVRDGARVRLCPHTCDRFVEDALISASLTAQSNATRAASGLPPLPVQPVGITASSSCDSPSRFDGGP